MSSRFSAGSALGGGRTRKSAPNMPPVATPQLTLSKLPSMNLELSQVVHRDAVTAEQGYTKVTLRGVPRFLIDAFARIQEEGRTVEGLFRKEGNASRLKNSTAVYYCNEPVTGQWTIHDLCSLVKRFLRDLKTPLICSDDIQHKLFNIARAHPDGIVEPHTLTILFEPSFSNKGIVHPMPPEHIGTLGFLMRQLYQLSQDSSVHQMNMSNLATVFAPTIFRDGGVNGEPPKTPKAPTKTQLVLQRSVEENDTRIAALIVLMKNAHWIGVPSNFYLSSATELTPSDESVVLPSSSTGAPTNSRWNRTNSIRPSSTSSYETAHSSLSSGSSVVNSLPSTNFNFHKADKGGSVTGRRIEKRHSVKMTIASRGRTEEKEQRDRGRRSNSTVRDIFRTIGEKVRRRSAERKSPSRGTSPIRVHSLDAPPSATRRRSPHKRMLVLEVDDVHTSMGSTSSNHNHRDRHGSHSRTAPPPPRQPSIKHQSTPHPHPPLSRPSAPPPTPPPRTTQPPKQMSGNVPIRSATITVGEMHTQPLPRRIRDEPVSILGEEYLNPQHKFPLNRVRRHTTPIKTGLALRRNQPNTVHSGLKGPLRRATLSAADDKENSRVIRRVVSRRKTDDHVDDDYDDDCTYYDEVADDTLKDEDRTMEGQRTTGIAVVYPSETMLELSHIETRNRRANWKRKKSVGSGIGGSNNGDASASSSTVALSPLRVDDTASSSSVSHSTPPPPLPQCSPPMVIVDEHVSSGRSEVMIGRRRSTKRAVVIDNDELFKPPPSLSSPSPLNLPSESSTQSSTSTSSPHFVVPSLPPLSNRLTATPSSSRNHTASIRSSPSLIHSPLGRRGSSASALDSPQFKPPSSLATRRQRSFGEKEFACSDRNKAAILEANDHKDLNVHTQVGMRPSVALLRNKNKGMVAARVNLFAAIQSTSDAENASMRSSLGSSRHSLAESGGSNSHSSSPLHHSTTIRDSLTSSGSGSSMTSSGKRVSIASRDSFPFVSQR